MKRSRRVLPRPAALSGGGAAAAAALDGLDGEHGGQTGADAEHARDRENDPERGRDDEGEPVGRGWVGGCGWVWVWGG